MLAYTDFQIDNDWQAAQRDRFLTRFYQKYAVGGRYVFVDKSACSTILQKQLAVDTIMQASAGKSLCIEEKIDRRGHETGNFALETVSHGKQGWMHYAQADYLLYAFALPDALDVYLINFPKLKRWFWANVETFKEREISTSNSRVSLVPVSRVTRNVPTNHYLCDDSGCQYLQSYGRSN